MNHLKQRQWQSANKSLMPYDSSKDESVDRIFIDLQRLSLDGIKQKTQEQAALGSSLMSVIVPGTGEVYCGQYEERLLFVY